MVDIGTDPLAPKIVAIIPLMNTIFGPDNLQITPDGKLGLVANSMDWATAGSTWKAVPERAHVSTSRIRRNGRPGDVASNLAGDQLPAIRVATRNSSAWSRFGVRQAYRHSLDAASRRRTCAITPDGKRAVAAKFLDRDASVLRVMFIREPADARAR